MKAHIGDNLIRPTGMRKIKTAPIISQVIVPLHIPRPQTTIPSTEKRRGKKNQNQGNGMKDATLFAGHGTYAAIASPASLLPL